VARVGGWLSPALSGERPSMGGDQVRWILIVGWGFGQWLIVTGDVGGTSTMLNIHGLRWPTVGEGRWKWKRKEREKAFLKMWEEKK
jgi:hypothetical protein